MSKQPNEDIIDLCNWYIGVLGDSIDEAQLYIRQLKEIKHKVQEGVADSDNVKQITVIQAYISRLTGKPFGLHVGLAKVHARYLDDRRNT